MDYAALGKVSLFEGLDEAELEKVAAAVRLEEVAKGTRLFSAGEHSLAFYVIESGRVRIGIPKTQVQEAKQVELEAGAFFGEMGVIRGRPRMAEADVIEDSRLLRVDQENFDRLLAVDAEIAQKITYALKQRVARFRSSEEAAEKAAADPKSFLFVGAEVGAGASFLVANLAVKLRELSGEEVLVVDLNLSNPSQVRYLGALSQLGSFSQIFANEEVTAAGVRDAAAHLALGVHLLAGTGKGSIMLSPEHIESLMPALREAYPYVLIDAGAEPASMTDAIARLVDTTHVVTTPAAGVEGAKALGARFLAQGLTGRLRYVLTQVADRKSSIEDLEFSLGEEFLGQVAAAEAGAAGVREGKPPMVQTHPKSAAAVDVTRLARSLLSMPEEEKNFSLWSLFGLG